MAHFNQFPNMLGIQTAAPPHNHNQAALQFLNAQRQAQQAATAAAATANEDSGEEATPICIKISTPLVINGDNNLVAIDPSVQAAKIAMAVVAALKQMSAGTVGVPMIDENGRPRQVNVEIEAEIKIEGTKNIVGEKAVLSTVANATKEGGKDAKDTRKRDRDDADSAGVVVKRIKSEE